MYKPPQGPNEPQRIGPISAQEKNRLASEGVQGAVAAIHALSMLVDDDKEVMAEEDFEETVLYQAVQILLVTAKDRGAHLRAWLDYLGMDLQADVELPVAASAGA